MKPELLKAIELAQANQWDAAHKIVQQYETDAIAAWIHAVLHKMEGDLDNSRYWYRRAGQMARLPDDAQAELAAIKGAAITQ